MCSSTFLEEETEVDWFYVFVQATSELESMVSVLQWIILRIYITNVFDSKTKETKAW